MSRLQDFLKGEDTQMGIFHPTGYILAVFPDLPGARKAAEALSSRGFGPDDALAVPGSDVMAMADEKKTDDGLWASLSQQLSRAIATSQSYADRDVEMAAEGRAFVLVHCPDEDRKKTAWGILRPLDPLAARYYTKAGMEHFVGDSLGLNTVPGHPDSPPSR